MVEGHRVVRGRRVELPSDRRSGARGGEGVRHATGGCGRTSDGRTAGDNATARSVFVIGPDKKIKATLTYPMSTGRNFAELLRLVDLCQLTAQRQLATPANWEQGDD